MNPGEIRAELRAAIDAWYSARATREIAQVEVNRSAEREEAAWRKLSAIRGLLDAYDIERMDIEKERNP